MDLFRSEPMQLVQLIVPIESAHLTIGYLGDLGLIQFKDAAKFFHSAKSSAAAQQIEFESQHTGEEFLETPLFSLQMANLRAISKLLPCDLDVTGSSRVNSLLQKCKERLRIIGRKWPDPSSDSTHSGSFVHRICPYGGLCRRQLLIHRNKLSWGFSLASFLEKNPWPLRGFFFRATRGNVFLKHAVLEEPVIDPVSGENV